MDMCGQRSVALWIMFLRTHSGCSVEKRLEGQVQEQEEKLVRPYPQCSWETVVACTKVVTKEVLRGHWLMITVEVRADRRCHWDRHDWERKKSRMAVRILNWEAPRMELLSTEIGKTTEVVWGEKSRVHSSTIFVVEALSCSRHHAKHWECSDD